MQSQMSRIWIAFFIGSMSVFILVSCASGGDATTDQSVANSAPVVTDAPPTETAPSQPAETQAPATSEAPTAVPTPSLAEIDLEALVSSVPLPSHLTPTVFSSEELLNYWRGSEQMSLGENFYNLSFHNEETGNPGGEVSIYVYDNEEAAVENITYVHEYYNTLIQPSEFDFVGQNGMQAAAPPFGHRAFLVCSVLINIRLSDATIDQIDAYAQQIARQLEDVACLDLLKE